MAFSHGSKALLPPSLPAPRRKVLPCSRTMETSILRRTVWRLFATLGLGLACLALSAEAGAQSEEEVAGARAAATEGIKAYNDGRWSAALDLFQRAESLLHAPTHLLYMARANAKLGRLVAARELYNKIIREPLGPKAPKAFQSAQEAAREEIAQVEPRLGKLTVTVEAPVGVIPVVKMDGESFPTALLGVARPIPAI